MYGRSFRNVTGIQHDGLHDIVLNHGKGIRLAGPEDTGNGFRMFNDADNNTLLQKQKSNGDWVTFIKVKQGSYADSELSPDVISEWLMPTKTNHKKGSYIAFNNHDNETSTSKDGSIYWHNEGGYIELIGVTNDNSQGSSSKVQHLAIKVEKTGDVEIPQLKRTASMADAAASQSLLHHFAKMQEFGSAASCWVNA